MNGFVRDGASWRDIQEDCAAVGQLPDPTQRLADRLLLRRRELLQAPLAVFEWAGQPDCDAGFLRFVVKHAGLLTLQTHALTSADRDVVVRLHDVVFSSLSSLDWWTPSGHKQLCDQFEAYLDGASATNDLSLWSAAGSLRRRLEKLVAAGDRRPAFLLALLLVWTPEEIDPIVLGDPVTKAAALAAGGGQITRVEFQLLIESVDQLYLRAKMRGTGAATTFLNASLPIFDSLALLPGLSPRQIAEIHHHRGKTYRRLYRDAE